MYIYPNVDFDQPAFICPDVDFFKVCLVCIILWTVKRKKICICIYICIIFLTKRILNCAKIKCYSNRPLYIAGWFQKWAGWFKAQDNVYFAIIHASA